MKLNLKSQEFAGIVAGAAFIGSAGHIMTVISLSNPWFISPVFPVAIDGLVYIGIRAVQEGRRVWGMLALLIGAFYSLAYNAHAEDALTMDKMLIASTLPVCMFAAILIESTKPKAKLEEAPAVIAAAAAPVAIPAPPIQWVSAGVRRTLPIAPRTAPAPVKVKSTVGRTSNPGRTSIEGRTDNPAIEGRVDGRTLRPATWDVEKAVRMLVDGQSNADVVAVVGTNIKAIQRARRAVRIMDVHPELTDEMVAEMMNRDVAPAHVGRIRAAMEKVSA